MLVVGWGGEGVASCSWRLCQRADSWRGWCVSHVACIGCVFFSSFVCVSCHGRGVPAHAAHASLSVRVAQRELVSTVFFFPITHYVAGGSQVLSTLPRFQDTPVGMARRGGRRPESTEGVEGAAIRPRWRQVKQHPQAARPRRVVSEAPRRASETLSAAAMARQRRPRPYLFTPRRRRALVSILPQFPKRCGVWAALTCHGDSMRSGTTCCAAGAAIAIATATTATSITAIAASRGPTSAARAHQRQPPRVRRLICWGGVMGSTLPW